MRKSRKINFQKTIHYVLSLQQSKCIYLNKVIIKKQVSNKKNIFLTTMSDSPYISNQLKQYMRKHNIEQTMNTSINQLLKTLPQDPYSYLIGLFQKKCTPDIQLVDLQLSEVTTGQGFSGIGIRAKVNYMNQQNVIVLEQPYGISGQENNLFDPQNKGMKAGISFFNDKIRPVIKLKKIKTSEHQLLDSQLVKAFNTNDKKGLYVINSISMAMQLLKSRVFNRPLYQVYADLAQREVKKDEVPAVFVNCLHGGKAIGSKCKVFKYYLMAVSKEGLGLIQPVVQAIRKTITSGKGGEAALKLSPDGTFICPLDTILDNLKIIQDSINITSNAKQHLKIGLSFQADTLFSPDTKKYELQNPKTPFDNDQMIDYLIKLLIDKPIIGYLQDPLASGELGSWAKLVKRIKETETLKRIKVGTRSGSLINLLGDNLKQRIAQVSVAMTEESHPDLSQQERQAKNAIKFSLSYVQIRLSQLRTVSNLIRINKLLQKTQTQLILQDNSFQTYNTQLVDVCFGLGAVCNLGSVAKYDRLSKVYRALEIVKERQEEF